MTSLRVNYTVTEIKHSLLWSRIKSKLAKYDIVVMYT